MSLNSLYVPIVSCPLACDGIVRDGHTHIPRGFFTQAKRGAPIKLLVVAQNPAQPWGAQMGAYANMNAPQRVQRQFQLVRDAMIGEQRHTFQVRLIAWLSAILSVPEPNVFNHVVYSNVVKCTTPSNRKPSQSLADTCASLHLVRELAFWKPAVIVGLGNVASEYLSKMGIAHELMPHPSNRKSTVDNCQAIERLRIKLQLTNERG